MSFGQHETHYFQYDKWLLLISMILLGFGLVMVASASMVVSDHQFGYPFYFMIHQCVFIALGLVLGFCCTRIPLDKWSYYSVILLFISLFLLMLVLIPGLGRMVNGSRRWLHLGVFSFQVSEFAKLAIIVYMSGYLVRRSDEVKSHLIGFVKPMVLVGLMSILLLLEPDFGATTVVMVVCLAMLFLAGVRLWQFLSLFLLIVLALVSLAVFSPYRMLRLTTFLHPWVTQFSSGYQLTQSLIAFGRGGWFGVGLGNSVQKLFYLPEAHTDFLFAVLGEELGLAGGIAVIGLYVGFLVRSMWIGRKALALGNEFAAYVAFGIGIWLAFQAMVNIGVNIGMLPTKGLTLPLMSYGGSSVMVTCIAIGLLLRVSSEVSQLNRSNQRIKRSAVGYLKGTQRL